MFNLLNTLFSKLYFYLDEITHGFDDQGQQFDKSGNLIDWWTDEAKQRFTKGAQCFIDQYGSIIDPGTKKNVIICMVVCSKYVTQIYFPVEWHKYSW